MPKNNILFPNIRVLSCPQCGKIYSKPLEPYIITTAPESPGIGLKCSECDYKIEWIVINALPMQTELFNAIMGAMSQIIKVAWLTSKKIDVGWRKDYDFMQAWIPKIIEMQEQLKALEAGGHDAKSGVR